MSALDGSRGKVERANQHIDDLRAAIQGFYDQNPYEIVSHDDPETGECVLSFRENVPLPARNVALIAGDAIHNLRSALDILFCELVIGNHRTVADGDVFPICKDRKSYESGALPGIKRRVSVDAFKIFENLEPYHGGHEVFWHLHRLDIIDKHRLLLATVASLGDVTQLFPSLDGPVEVGGLTLDGKLEVTYELPDKGPLKDGDELVRFPSQPEENVKFRMDVALHEPPVAECEPILPFLPQLAGEVNRVLDLFAPTLRS